MGSKNQEYPKSQLIVILSEVEESVLFNIEMFRLRST